MTIEARVKVNSQQRAQVVDDAILRANRMTQRCMEVVVDTQDKINNLRLPMVRPLRRRRLYTRLEAAIEEREKAHKVAEQLFKTRSLRHVIYSNGDMRVIGQYEGKHIVLKTGTKIVPHENRTGHSHRPTASGHVGKGSRKRDLTEEEALNLASEIRPAIETINDELKRWARLVSGKSDSN